VRVSRSRFSRGHIFAITFIIIYRYIAIFPSDVRYETVRLLCQVIKRRSRCFITACAHVFMITRSHHSKLAVRTLEWKLQGRNLHLRVCSNVLLLQARAAPGGLPRLVKIRCSCHSIVKWDCKWLHERCKYDASDISLNRFAGHASEMFILSRRKR